MLPPVSRDPVKVMIVDDHPVFREGLRQCLEARKEIRVVAATGGGEEAWKAIRAHGLPQVVLMDVEMPGQSGIELTKELHEKRCSACAFPPRLRCERRSEVDRRRPCNAYMLAVGRE